MLILGASFNEEWTKYPHLRCKTKIRPHKDQRTSAQNTYLLIIRFFTAKGHQFLQ